MKFYRFTQALLMVMLFALATPMSFAQEGGLWERAFARPHGAILADEILYQPERFMVRNQGQQIRVAGKFQEPNLTRDGSKTRATIVWGGRYRGVACLSSNRTEMLKVVDLVAGEEVLATGIVDSYDGNWLYLEHCTIEAGVTLFHSRDPRFVLGTWCSVYEGQAQRKYRFSQGDKGNYFLENAELDHTGNWRPYSSVKPARIKRVSASRIETAIIGRTADYARNRFTIISHNQMSVSDGSQFHRCQ